MRRIGLPLLLATALAVGQQQPNSTAHAPEARLSHSDSLAVAARTSETGQTRRNYEREAADNEARTAFATEVLAGLTLLLALGTVAVAGYTFRLWRATQRMAVDAKDASEKTLAHQELTAKRELRAYISILSVKATPSPTQRIIPPRPYAAYYRVEYHNSGQTPAYSVEIVAELKVSPFPPTGPLPLKEFGPDAYRSRTIVGGRSTLGFTASGFSPASQDVGDEIMARTKEVYLVGLITYIDIFGDSHSTRFQLVRHENEPRMLNDAYGNEAD